MKIIKGNENYTAIVIKLPIKQNVSGLDNLKKVTIFGNDVLVGKNDAEDDLYLFFCAGTKLSQKFLSNNNLYRDHLLNSNQELKGFFEPNGRVKVLKFKGIISTGFVVPVSSLNYLGKCDVNIGDTFNSIAGDDVAMKYIVKSNVPSAEKKERNNINSKLVELLIPNQFRFHENTAHLSRNLDKLFPEDIIIITDKWHGSSCILSKVLIKKRLGVFNRILNKIGWSIPKQSYGYIYSSGKPKSNLVKGIETNSSPAYTNSNQDYYSSNIWKRAFDDWKHTLEDGISLYGELVGYTKNGGYIQNKYDYSCKPGEYKFIIYRITYTKSDGSKIEFSWQQIKNYCLKYGLEHVKELYFGKITKFGSPNNFEIGEEEHWMKNVYDEFCFTYLEKDCKWCINTVPSEGIVVRRDGMDSFEAYKLKSKKFLLDEEKELEKGEENLNSEENA